MSEILTRSQGHFLLSFGSCCTYLLLMEKSMKAAAAYSIEPRKYPRSQSFARILGKKIITKSVHV